MVTAEDNGTHADDINVHIILDNACQFIIMLETAATTPILTLECCKKIIATLEDDNPDEVALITKNSRNAWHKSRQFRITGSRIYEIYTYGGHDWPKKCERYFFPKSFTSKFTSHGLQQEPHARRLFEDTTGYKIVETGLLISPSNKWLGYSPDGVVIINNQPQTLLEIKCPFQGNKPNIICSFRYYFQICD